MDFSLDEQARKIVHFKIKEYFKETLSSYNNANYRAAITTLYSVVITDLIYKLQFLKEIFNDTKAENILKEIQKEQNNNIYSPNWEKKLLKEIKEKTHLLNDIEFNIIEQLREMRNLCAHPVIGRDNILYTPNKDESRALIRNMLAIVLTRPPLLDKRILENILLDIKDKPFLRFDDTLEKYIISKYAKNMNKTLELQLFKDLWKFVFKLTNNECKENRLVNSKLLMLFYKRNFNSINKMIQNESDYFNKINFVDDITFYFIHFLSNYPDLYKYFNDEIKILLKGILDNVVGYEILAWFISPSYENHMNEIKKKIFKFDYKIRKETFRIIDTVLNKGIDLGKISTVVDFIIFYYTNSKNFNEADLSFANFINQNLKYFNGNYIEILLSEIEKNNQCYDRNHAKEDHLHLFNYIKENFPNINIKAYPNTFKDIK